MTTTELARSFADQIADIEDLPIDALEPGRMSWLHGVKQAKMPGVFYIKAANLSETPGAPWADDNERFEGEDGYSTPKLQIAIIGFRSQWFVPDEDRTKPPKEWLLGYQEGIGAKKITEYLCLVEGINDPIVLSMSGKNKGQPMWDIFKAYQNGLLKQGSRIAKRQLPVWSFWLPIANKRTPEGKTFYEDAKDGAGNTYGSVVTPPALYLPDNPLDTLYVGADIIRLGASIHNDFSEWFKVKRLPQGTVEGQVTVSATKALPPARNVPQPLKASEYTVNDDADEEVEKF
jgi:hypothetical protein